MEGKLEPSVAGAGLGIWKMSSLSSGIYLFYLEWGVDTSFSLVNGSEVNVYKV